MVSTSARFVTRLHGPDARRSRLDDRGIATQRAIRAGAHHPGRCGPAFRRGDSRVGRRPVRDSAAGGPVEGFNCGYVYRLDPQGNGTYLQAFCTSSKASAKAS